MATIHLTEIERILRKSGARDAEPWGEEGYFVEIRFDRPGIKSGTVDPEYANKVLSVDCPYGLVVIQFDDEGLLASIDIS